MPTFPGFKIRYDFILIWGHGLKYKDAIIDIIRTKSHLEILKILNHKTKKIRRLVKAIYSYDYAPFHHLKSKTKYLLSTKPDVVFIFVKNKNVKEVYTGEGQFRHLECEYIKNIKEEIRDKFNWRKNDSQAEEHVVHASDNESHTDYILKYLGFKKGIELFKNVPHPFISAPFHINQFNKFVLRYVNSSQVYCNILVGTNDSFSMRLSPIEETPHYLCLTGNVKLYKKYLDEFSGSILTDDYSVAKLTNLSKNFSYLAESYSNCYILTKEIEPDKYQILDGVNRVCILKFQGCENFIIAVVK